MPRFKRLFAALIVVFIISMGILPLILSQENTGDITCDADLILTWYMADRYFAFGTLQSALSQTADPSTVLDLSRYNQGQFTPLFESLRTAQDPNTRALPGINPTQEWFNAVAAVLQMDDASFQDFLNSMQTTGVDAFLVPGSVAGEAPECVQLRSQLQRFFAAVNFQDMEAGFASSFGTNANANVNTNTNTNDNTDGNVNANTNDNTGTGGTDANTNTNDNTGATAPPPDTNTNANDNTGGGDDNANTNDNSDDGEDNSGSGSNGDDDNSGSGSGGGDNSGSGSGGDEDDD